MDGSFIDRQTVGAKGIGDPVVTFQSIFLEEMQRNVRRVPRGGPDSIPGVGCINHLLDPLLIQRVAGQRFSNGPVIRLQKCANKQWQQRAEGSFLPIVEPGPQVSEELGEVGAVSALILGVVGHDRAGDRFSVILRGLSDVIYKDVKIAQLGEGQFVGEIDLRADAYGDIDVLVRTAARVMCWPRARLQDFLSTRPDVALALQRSVGYELQQLLDETADLMPDEGRAAQAAADEDAIADRASLVLDDLDADVVDHDRGAVGIRA